MTTRKSPQRPAFVVPIPRFLIASSSFFRMNGSEQVGELLSFVFCERKVEGSVVRMAFSESCRDNCDVCLN